MSRQSKAIKLIVLLVACNTVLLVQMLPVHGFNGDLNGAMEINQVSSKGMTSLQGIQYKLSFDRQNSTLDLVAVNEKEEVIDKTGFVISVDGYRLHAERNLTFRSGEEKYWKVNVAKGINVMNYDHVATVSTFGDSVMFNFTRDVKPSQTSLIPTPYIENVQIINSTIDGEPSAVAKVTVANPSIHPYPLKLMVHTIETDGSFYGAAVPPGENRTITVELLDERGSQIAGEARLYAGNLSQGDGAMDQVGFAGQAGEDTKAWNETYKPIEGPWRSDSYEYRNETYEDDTSLAERISGGYEIFGIPVVYFVTGLVAGLVLFRRIR